MIHTYWVVDVTRYTDWLAEVEEHAPLQGIREQLKKESQ